MTAETPAGRTNLVALPVSLASAPPLVEPSSAAPRPVWRAYKEVVAAHAARIAEAHRYINVLQSLRWERWVEQRFRQNGGLELPCVDAEYWSRAELGFDPRVRIAEADELARDIERELGPHDALGRIMLETVLQIRDLVRMLEARGTKAFYEHSKRLFGSPKDRVPESGMSIRDLSIELYETFSRLNASWMLPASHKNIGATEAAALLADRLAHVFGEGTVQVVVDGDVLADAAATMDRIKLREGVMFSVQDIDVLEVHEGWVHVGTSLNGQAQPVARWLAKGTPRTTSAQEGLAVLMEIVTGRSYPRRAKKLSDRVIAVDKAEDGASFLDVHEWYRTEGYEEDDCFRQTRRVFRGGVMEGGAPFTKDISYNKGLAQSLAFVERAVRGGRLDWLPLMFVGKVAHDDIPVLAEHVASGLVRAPKYLPQMFRHVGGIVVMLSVARMLGVGARAQGSAREG